MAEFIKCRLTVVWTNPKASKALGVLLNTLNEIGDDFEYRDDVKRAIRAARYLVKHVGVRSELEDDVTRLET